MNRFEYLKKKTDIEFGSELKKKTDIAKNRY